MKLEKKSVPVKEEPPVKCLAPEKISAFLDGEEELSPEEEAHFYSCSECQRLFRSYRNMGSLLEEALEEEVKKLPESGRFLEKIHERLYTEYGIPCKEMSSCKERFSFVPLQILTRVAAILLFLAFAFLLVIQVRKGEENSPVVAKNVKNAPLQGSPGPAFMPSPFSSVDIDSLVPAAAGERKVQFMPEHKSGADPVLIPYQVKQLWLIPKNLSQKELEKLLGSPLRKKGKELTLAGVTTRVKTVELVKKLGSRRYKLLTPVPPQPEDTRFLGTGREKVQLLLTFLPEE